MKSISPSKRIIVIGLDGASWRLVHNLMKDGELQNLSRLKINGASGILKSIEPPLSPSIWTTISSGKLPEKHGIKDFISTSESVRCKRLWDICEERGMSVGLCGHMVTWPPRKINGFIIPDPFAQGSETFPEELSFIRDLAISEKMKRKRSIRKYINYTSLCVKHGISPATICSALMTLLGNKLKRKNFLDKFYVARLIKLRMYTELFIHLCKKRKPDLSIYCDNTTDSLPHNYWKFMEPDRFEDVSQRDVTKYKNVIPNAYKNVDKKVGDILSLIDDDTTVVIVSDHGFKADTSLTSGNPYTIRTEALLQKIEAPDRVRATNIASRVIIRDKYEDVKEVNNIIDKLSSVKIKGSGEQLLRIQKDWFPSIIVSLNLNSINLSGITAVFPDQSECLLEDIVEVSKSRMSGEHDIEDGIVILCGRNIKKGAAIENADVTDITPTILTLMGLPVGNDMDGKVLAEAIDDEFLKKYPVRHIETYEDEGSSAERSDDGQLTEELKRQLMALGYLS